MVVRFKDKSISCHDVRNVNAGIICMLIYIYLVLFSPVSILMIKLSTYNFSGYWEQLPKMSHSIVCLDSALIQNVLHMLFRGDNYVVKKYLVNVVIEMCAVIV